MKRRSPINYTLLIIFITSLWLTACNFSNTTEHPIISAYSEAWNNKDLEGMSSLMHPDIEWLSVTGNDISIEVSGKDALSQGIQGYFESPDLPTSSLRGWSVNGDYISVTETAHWTNKAGEPQSQSSLTVYELNDGLIRRVYYYPSVQDE